MTTVRLQAFPSVGTPTSVDYVYVTQSGVEYKMTLTQLISFLRLASFAANGANSDITSLTGLTTPLSVAQGGTGVTTHTGSGAVVGQNSPTIDTPNITSALLLSGLSGGSGDQLKSQGPGQPPVWSSSAGVFSAYDALNVLQFLKG